MAPQQRWVDERVESELVTTEASNVFLEKKMLCFMDNVKTSYNDVSTAPIDLI